MKPRPFADGGGVPVGFDPTKGKGVGMRVITTLVSRINATLTFESEGRGATFSIARG